MNEEEISDIVFLLLILRMILYMSDGEFKIGRYEDETINLTEKSTKRLVKLFEIHNIGFTN